MENHAISTNISESNNKSNGVTNGIAKINGFANGVSHCNGHCDFPGIGNSKSYDDSGTSITPGYGGRVNGMGYLKTTYFLVAMMVGAGFLALPRAIADSGWIGIFMLFLFAGSVGFAASRMGKCWIILEERWPQYRLPARQPYMDMAERAFGPIGRKICFGCTIFTLIGYGISFIILMAEMVNILVPQLSRCQWILIITLLLWPAIFFGTPKDFWQASVLAVAATCITVVVITIQLCLDIPKHVDPQYPNPTVVSFSLGFSGIMFSFGGASVFPTIQNDMQNRKDWSKTVLVGFCIVLILYLPVAIVGYVTIGDAVSSNILMDATPGVAVMIAIFLNVINLLVTYAICFNPVAQSFEDILHLPEKLTWKGVILRTGIVLFELAFSLAIPSFGAILNFIGGSTVAALCFIFPPLMYIRLVDMPNEDQWPERTIPLWERIFLWLIVAVAVVGSITSTIAALFVILDPSSFNESCL